MFGRDRTVGEIVARPRCGTYSPAICRGSVDPDRPERRHEGGEVADVG